MVHRDARAALPVERQRDGPRRRADAATAASSRGAGRGASPKWSSTAMWSRCSTTTGARSRAAGTGRWAPGLDRARLAAAEPRAQGLRDDESGCAPLNLRQPEPRDGRAAVAATNCGEQALQPPRHGDGSQGGLGWREAPAASASTKRIAAAYRPPAEASLVARAARSRSARLARACRLCKWRRPITTYFGLENTQLPTRLGQTCRVRLYDIAARASSGSGGDIDVA